MFDVIMVNFTDGSGERYPANPVKMNFQTELAGYDTLYEGSILVVLSIVNTRANQNVLFGIIFRYISPSIKIDFFLLNHVVKAFLHHKI